MKNRKNAKLNIALVLLLVVLLMLPTQALSKGKPNRDQPLPEPPPGPPGSVCEAEPPDGDFDDDGFTNQQECPPGLDTQAPNYTAAFDYPSCIDYQGDREYCLDPENKDIFVMLVTLGPNSLIPADPDPLRYVNCRYDDPNCLGITTHVIHPNDPDQPFPDRSVIVGGPKAVRVTESPDINVEQFGQAWRGTPTTGQDDAKVYTYRIRDFVNSKLGGDHPEVYVPHIWHTIAHEIGHMVNLWTKYTARYGGWHLRARTGKIMEESVKVQGTTFFISDQYDDSSIGGFALH